MPKNTAECGKREERAIVKDLTARGYRARRQPGSGNVDPTLPHDVVWEDSPIGKLLIESKWRSSCGWKTLLKWMEGAPILTLKCGAGQNQHVTTVNADSDRYVFMKWDTLLALIGSASERSEILSDLLPVEVDKPQLVEADMWGPPRIPSDQAIRNWERRTSKIQAAHQDPPKRKPKPNKLGGKGFGR